MCSGTSDCESCGPNTKNLALISTACDQRNSVKGSTHMHNCLYSQQIHVPPYRQTIVPFTLVLYICSTQPSTRLLEVTLLQGVDHAPPPPPHSYHQKYLLRQQSDILSGLGITDEELITSHAACRLNGYCGGYGTTETLEKELPNFGLSPEAQDKARKIVARGSFQ